MTGLDRAAGLTVSIPTPSSLTSSTTCRRRRDDDVDRRRTRVLDGVDDQLLRDPQQQRVDDRPLIDRALRTEVSTVRDAGNGAMAATSDGLEPKLARQSPDEVTR